MQKYITDPPQEARKNTREIQNMHPGLSQSNNKVGNGDIPLSPMHIHVDVRVRLVGRAHILKGNIEERACRLAVYIIENKATVRAAAGRFGISKSTVHSDVIK